MMVNRIIVLVFLISFYKVSWAQCVDAIDSFIVWHDYDQLRFEDFKGVQDSSFLVYGFPANGAAVTKLEISLTFNDDENPTVIVVNKFLKEKSWIKVNKPHVLSHEQGHFDISEVFARKIRKAVDSLMSCQIKDEQLYELEIHKLLQAKAEYQKRYDEQTHHGFILEKQKEWEDAIKKELYELKKYAK